MFPKRKYVLVKHEHEVNVVLKMVMALLILLTVFGTPILLEMGSKRILGDKETGNSTRSKCGKGHKCPQSGDEPNNQTTETAGEVLTVVVDQQHITPNTTGQPQVTPISLDYDYEYTDDEWHHSTTGDDYDMLWWDDANDTTTQNHSVGTTSTDDDQYLVIPATEKVVSGKDIVNDFYAPRQGMNLSALGEMLFKQAPFPPAKDQNFKILIWKDGKFLERRHINYFTNTKHDPFENCSVKNCILSYNDEDRATADAVVFLLLRQTKESLPDLTEARPSNQRWIFLSDENPLNTFLSKNAHWSNFSGIFNWSMTYRMESDIPVPNARVVPLDSFQENKSFMELIPEYGQKQRDVLMAVLLNNCTEKNPMYKYIQEMQKHIKIDVYGKCSNVESSNCPVYFAKDCPALNKYLFYFTFENARCNQFISQKMFWNSYEKGSIPIVAGVSKSDCQTILPPNSYIHIKDFSSAQGLANHVLHINNTLDDSYYKLHEWRKYFQVINEHGYFGSASHHYCRICQALNYNNGGQKVYGDLSKFLSPEDNCAI